MRLLIFILPFLISSLSSGQDFHSYYKERYFSTDTSTLYFDLLQRFQDSDSTLIFDDFKDLYYGAVFLNSYDPAKITEAEDKIRQANFDKNYQQAFDLADSLLTKYPMSIQAYFEKSWASHNLQLPEEEEYNRKRYKVLIKVVMDSGDGASLTSAWYSNLPNDEFEVLKYLKLDSKEEKEISYDRNVFDIFLLKPNKAKIKEVYFNVTRQRR